MQDISTLNVKKKYNLYEVVLILLSSKCGPVLAISLPYSAMYGYRNNLSWNNSDFVFHWLCRCVATVTIASICALSKPNVIMSCYWWFWFKFAAQQRQRHVLLSTLFILLLVCCGVEKKYIFWKSQTIDWKRVLYKYLVLLLCVLLSLHLLLHCIKAAYSSNNAEVLLVINLLNVRLCWTGRMKWFSIPIRPAERHCKQTLLGLTLKMHWLATLLGAPALHVGLQSCHSLHHLLGHSLLIVQHFP